VDKLTSYFVGEISRTPPHAIDQWETLAEKAAKLFHENHYVNNLLRISLNANYIRYEKYSTVFQ